MKNFSNKNIIFVLFFICFGAPFLVGFGVLPLTNFVNELFSVVGLTGIFLVKIFDFNEIPIFRRLLGWWLFFLIVFFGLIVNYYFSGYFSASVYILGLMFVFFGAFALFLGSLFSSSLDWVECEILCARVIFFGAACAACASIAQYFYLDFSIFIVSPSAESGRTFGFLRQSNQQATYLALGVLSAQYLCYRGRLIDWVGYLYSAVLFFALLSTGSRTGVLQVFFVLTAILFFSRASTIFLRRVFFLFLIFVFVLLLMYFLDQFFSVSFYALEKMEQTGREGIGLRRDIWLHSLDAIKSNPLTGMGGFLFPSWFYLSGGGRFGVLMEHSHNLFLQVAICFGLPGLGLVFYNFSVYLMRFFSVALGDCWFFASLVFVILIHSQFEYPLWYLNFLIPFFFALGFFLAKNDVIVFKLRVSLVWRNFLIFLAFLILIGAVKISREYFVVSRLFSPVYASSFSENLAKSKELFWFRNYSGFAYFSNEGLKTDNAGAYVSRVLELGCVMNEAWVQPSTSVAFFLEGRKEDAYWLVFVYGLVTKNDFSMIEKVARNVDGGELKEFFDYLRNPYPISSRVGHLLGHCGIGMDGS